MVRCPFSSCWASPQEESKTTNFPEDRKIHGKPLEKDVKPTASGSSDAYRTASSTILSSGSRYPDWYPRLLFDSDAALNATPTYENEEQKQRPSKLSEEQKPTPPKLTSEGTSSNHMPRFPILPPETANVALKPGKRSIILQDPQLKRRSNKILQKGTRISRHSKSKHLITGVSESGERRRQQTVISDWGDAYEETGDLRISNYDSSNLSRVVDNSIWSDTITSRNSGVARLESSLVLPKCQISALKMPIRKGWVLAMLLTKEAKRFKMLNLNISLQEVVDTFLNNGTGPSIPVSFSYANETRPRVMSENRMGMSLADNLRGYLDETTQGITFFVGSVNSKLCYKMSICDLGQLHKSARQL